MVPQQMLRSSPFASKHFGATEFFEDCHFVSWCSKARFPVLSDGSVELAAVSPHGSRVPRSVERTPKLPALGVRWAYVTFRSRVFRTSFVHFISLWRSNCSLLDDQLRMMAYSRCDFLLQRTLNCSRREVVQKVP